MEQSRGFFPFGRSCIGLLVLAIAIRVSLPLLPCHWAGPSGYICAAAYLKRPATRPHTFVANDAIPEGARVSNRIDFLTFRPERFTVDELGYRNGPGPRITTPKVVLFGSSFSMGMALNDDETFSASLNESLGPIVYNASWTLTSDLDPGYMAKIAGQSGMAGGLILVEVLNRTPFTYSEAPSRERRDAVVKAIAPAIIASDNLRQPPALIRGSTLINMQLHDGRLLPNPFARAFSEEELISGRHVLVNEDDKGFALHPAASEGTVSALLRLRDGLGKRGYRLAVFLLPNAYSVYSPLMRSATEPDRSEEYMGSIEAQMKAGAVPVLNLLPILREAASNALSGGRIIYLADDAHWNPLGCSIAAHATAPWLQGLLR